MIAQALHLVSDDRILIADLFRAGDQWGSFLLGHPPDDDATADNWSLILGAGLVGLGLLLPIDEASGEGWDLDLLFGWDVEPALEFLHAERVAADGNRARDPSQPHQPGWAPDRGARSVRRRRAAERRAWGMFFALDLGGGMTIPVGSALELR